MPGFDDGWEGIPMMEGFTAIICDGCGMEQRLPKDDPVEGRAMLRASAWHIGSGPSISGHDYCPSCRQNGKGPKPTDTPHLYSSGGSFSGVHISLPTSIAACMHHIPMGDHFPRSAELDAEVKELRKALRKQVRKGQEAAEHADAVRRELESERAILAQAHEKPKGDPVTNRFSQLDIRTEETDGEDK